MEAIDFIKLGSQGRIIVTDFFGGITPRHVQISVSIDSDQKCIFLRRSEEPEDSQCVDVKGRVFIPSWIRHSFSSPCIGFFVVYVDGEKVLIPTTKLIDWSEYKF